MTMLLDESFFSHLRDYTQKTEFCLALSGGLDSCVLLHLFHEIRKQNPHYKLRAIHVHHGLNLGADRWAKFCKEICHHYEIPLTIEKILICKEQGESLEELARNERYEVFKNFISDQEVLLTAHHQDDQAETVLLQLFRGAGPKGLASMPIYTTFANGFLLRPLLFYQRAEISAYAETKELVWVEDESNQNTQFDRNFIRKNVLPLIKTRWPCVSQNLMRVAGHCAKANGFIEANIQGIFLSIFDPSGKRLSIEKLLEYDEITQNYVLRYWLQYLGLGLPSTSKLQLLRPNLLFCRPDSMPVLFWKGVEVRRFDNHLYAFRPLLPHDASAIYDWDLRTGAIALPNGLATISVNNLIKQGLEMVNLPQVVTIRFRQGGERCTLPGRTHQSSLKKLFNAWRIPPWERSRIPLIYAGEAIVAIVGYAICTNTL